MAPVSGRNVDWRALERRLREAEAALSRSWADDEQRARRIFAQRAERLARPAATTTAGREPALLFRVAGERCALALAAVTSAVRLARWAPVPEAPAELLGLLSWRGAILPLVDLARLLGLPGVGQQAPTTALVLRDGPALAVGAVDGVATLPDDLSPPPRGTGERPLVAGVTADALVVLDEAALRSHPLIEEASQA
jgi:purine-binding chemotaxis protein CheW